MIRGLHVQLLIVLLAMGVPALAQICDVRSGAPMQMQVQLAFDNRVADAVTGSVWTQNDSMHRGDVAAAERGGEFTSDLQIRVRLEDPSGGTLQDLAPTAEGQVRISVCKNTIYRLRVFGPTIEEAVLDSVQPGRGDKLVIVVLHRKLTKQEQKARTATISAQRLRVPKRAQKQLVKGDAALKQGKLEDARKYYSKAVQVYPQFEEAEDKLGVVLMQQGKKKEGRTAFERAVAINRHYAPAQVNLAKIYFDEKQFKDAALFARQALSSEPFNPGALCVAAESAFFQKDYGETISYAHTLHALPHKPCSLAHFLAGKSLEAEHQPEAAISEYQIFLEEDPDDPNAPRARELLILLQSARTAESPQIPPQ